MLIAGPGLSTAIRHRAVTNISAMRRSARRDGLDVGVTAVAPNLNLRPHAPFDAIRMNTGARAGLVTGRLAHGRADGTGPLPGHC